jgi:hypothetical protein
MTTMAVIYIKSIENVIIIFHDTVNAFRVVTYENMNLTTDNEAISGTGRSPDSKAGPSASRISFSSSLFHGIMRDHLGIRAFGPAVAGANAGAPEGTPES